MEVIALGDDITALVVVNNRLGVEREAVSHIGCPGAGSYGHEFTSTKCHTRLRRVVL